MKYADSRGILLDLLSGGSAMSAREMIRASGLNINQVENAIFRCWVGGLVLRTEKPLYEREKVNRGRRDRVEHTRSYHRYVISKGLSSARAPGIYTRFEKSNKSYARVKQISNLIIQGKDTISG